MFCLADANADCLGAYSYIKNIKTLQSRFEQVNEIDNSKSFGSLYVKSPSKIRWEYDYPSPVVLLIRRNLVTYYDRDLDTEYNVFSKDFDVFNRDYECQENKDNVILYDEREDKTIKLLFSKQDSCLKSILIKNDENDIKINLQSIEYNVELHPKTFSKSWKQDETIRH